ncbi:hypothetical protein UJ101_02713 [Flavobacteriaceae bacterium UJ101]|nr:hypothetical protein UJ101_02713 [Flavobacteriaceae bacterium UJ101]
MMLLYIKNKEILKQVQNDRKNIKRFRFSFFIFHFSFILSFFNFVFSQDKLEDYIKIAIENHPKLQADSLQYQAILESVNEVGNIMDTQFSGGVFLSTPETRVGPQNVKLGAKQQFPWLGTQKAQKEVVKTQADVQLERIRDTQFQLRYKTQLSYYQLSETEQKIVILKENLALLDTYERLALKNLENNLATMADVLKIRMSKNELNTQIENEKSNLEVQKRDFNRMLYRNREEFIQIEPLEELVNLPLLDSLSNFENHPLVNRFEKERTVLEKESQANQKESLPKVGFGLDYVLVSERSDLNVADNGKDIVMPMVSLSIPLFNKKYKAKAKRLQIQNEANYLAEKDQIITLENMLDNTLNQFVTSKKNVETYNQNITESKRVQKLVITNYTTGRMDYDEILEIQELTLRYQLLKIKELHSLYQQKALMEYLLTQNTNKNE